MEKQQLRAKRLSSAFGILAVYKAVLCILAFLASFGLGEFILHERVDGHALILLRYTAWFCFILAGIYWKASKAPLESRWLLKLNVPFFLFSALVPPMNLFLPPGVFWVWWIAMGCDTAMLLLSARTLAVTKD